MFLDAIKFHNRSIQFNFDIDDTHDVNAIKINVDFKKTKNVM